MSETELEMVTRHLQQADRIVGEQEMLVAKLRREGRDTQLSEGVLQTFRDNLALAQAHMNRLRSPKPT